MNYHQIAEKIRNGTMQFEHQGHWECSSVKEREVRMKEFIFKALLEQYDDYVKLSNGSNDGKWNSQKEDRKNAVTDEQMRKHYLQDLERDYSEIFHGDLFYLPWDYECFECGERIKFYCPDDTKIVAFTDYKGYVDGVSNPCILPKYRPYRGTINVNSDLIFTNFFYNVAEHLQKDNPNEKWDQDYSLNASIGRIRIADYKSKEQNVAYGQMGNMSIGVYVNKNHDRIILDSPWDKEFKGYKDYGRISLAVWRYEVTDMNTLKLDDSNYPAFKEKCETDYLDIVRVPAKHGKWKFVHYYDSCKKPKHYAVFQLT